MIRRIVQNRQRVLVEIGAIGLLGAAVISAPQSRGQVQVPAEALPVFEVASVRLRPEGNVGLTSISPYGNGRFTAANTPLELLIEIAFGVPDTQISGAPSWLGSERYDVNAKAVDGVSLTYDQLKPRLQQLLVQRFKLATHRETKIFDGYALIVAKGGPKLQPTKGSTAQGIIYPSGLRIPNATMEGLASWLTGPTGRHVIDKIGIEGNYDIQLEYAPLGSDDTFLPSIFTAVQKQLGLKLEHQKVPVEILVIDHVERTHDRKLAGGRRRACR